MTTEKKQNAYKHLRRNSNTYYIKSYIKRWNSILIASIEYLQFILILWNSCPRYLLERLTKVTQLTGILWLWVTLVRFCCVTAPTPTTAPTKSYFQQHLSFILKAVQVSSNTSRFRSALPLTPRRLFETAFPRVMIKNKGELALPGQPAHLTSSWSPSWAHIPGWEQDTRLTPQQQALRSVRSKVTDACTPPEAAASLEPTAKAKPWRKEEPHGQLSEGYVATDQAWRTAGGDSTHLPGDMPHAGVSTVLADLRALLQCEGHNSEQPTGKYRSRLKKPMPALWGESPAIIWLALVCFSSQRHWPGWK